MTAHPGTPASPLRPGADRRPRTRFASRRPHALRRAAAAFLVALAPAVLPGCLGKPTVPPPPRPLPAAIVPTWHETVLWEGPSALENVAVGEIDAAARGDEIVATDGEGRVVLVHAGMPHGPVAGATTNLSTGLTTNVIHRAAGRLPAIAVGDVDPQVPGPEIYVAGSAGPDETGPGAVLQIVLTRGVARVKKVHTSGGLVFALAVLPPKEAGGVPELALGNARGAVEILTPLPNGPWSARTAYAEDAPADGGSPEVRDLAVLPPQIRIGEDGTVAPADPAPGEGPPLGPPPRFLVAACRSGTLALVPADGGPSFVLLRDSAGIARVHADPAGRLWLGGFTGRAHRIDPVPGGWASSPLIHDAGALRGVAHGRFAWAGPAGTGNDIAYAGSSRFCRILGAGAPPGDAVHTDDPSGSGFAALAALDALPGDGIDELVGASTTGRLLLLSLRAPSRDQPSR